MKKIILLGLLVGVVNLILGMIISYLFMMSPQVASDYSNTAIMRQWSDPAMSLFFLYSFVLGIILAWVWQKSKILFHGNWMQRGIKFSLAIFLIDTIPGMLISYSSFPLSLMTIISWTVSGLVCVITAGLIFAKLNS